MYLLTYRCVFVICLCFCVYTFVYVYVCQFVYVFLFFHFYFKSIRLSIHLSVFVCPLVFLVHRSICQYQCFLWFISMKCMELLTSVIFHITVITTYELICFQYHFRCMYFHNKFIHSKIHHIICCPFPSNDFVILWKNPAPLVMYETLQKILFPRHPVIFSADNWGVQSPSQHSI